MGELSHSDDHAKRLVKRLERRLGGANVPGDSDEQAMAGAFGDFTPEERQASPRASISLFSALLVTGPGCGSGKRSVQKAYAVFL